MDKDKSNPFINHLKIVVLEAKKKNKKKIKEMAKESGVSVKKLKKIIKGS